MLIRTMQLQRPASHDLPNKYKIYALWGASEEQTRDLNEWFTDVEQTAFVTEESHGNS